MNDLTVIYFTSNRERPEFEKKIQQTLLNTIDGLPLISVSHKPINFGLNICVGESKPSTHVAVLQIEMGVREAKTKFVCLAESDFLYPKEYFTFEPKKEDVAYLMLPIYILFTQSRKAKIFAKKAGSSDSVLMVGRDHFLDGIQKALNKGIIINFRDVLNFLNCETFKMRFPAITFKTDENMHRKAPIFRSTICRELPGWGASHSLIESYMK